MLNFYKLFLLFIVYSFLGWCMEVITMFVQKRKFINCGALIGPYCPIYGIAAILIIVLLNRFKGNPILLFFFSVIICSIVEYITSFLLEKILNIKWWDYSSIKFNLNGRICLKVSLLFGFLGIFFTYIATPVIYNSINSIHPVIITTVALFTLIIFASDIFNSYKIMNNLKINDTMQLDIYTQKITEIIKKKGSE